jgi:arylsulfatase A-like enzyme
MTPNILLFLTDDHAQWALGCYGNREIRTPSLDYLAQTGVQMRNAFTPTPVCSPARACLHTGQLASQHGIHDYLSSEDADIDAHNWLGDSITLAHLLHEAGYQTAQCGKWHLGHDEHPQADYDNWFTLGRGYPIPHHGPHEYGFDGEHQAIPGYITQIVTDRAIEFLRQRATHKPFFLTVGYYATHSPWQDHPERLVASYRQSTFEDIPQDVMYPFGRQNLESTDATRNNPREALAQYYAAVTEIDEGVGRLIDELNGLGILDETLIIYTSDHGLNCGHHGIWGKGNGTLPLNMVEESIRVPLIFWHSGLLYGRQQRPEFADHLDTFQTILAAANVTPPEGNYAGRSLWPLLQNRHIPDWRRVQFGEYGDVRMVRTEQYKLVLRYPNEVGELFDLQADPREVRNLFGEPEYVGLVAELTAVLQAHFARYQDPHNNGLRVRELPQHNFTEAWR